MKKLSKNMKKAAVITLACAMVAGTVVPVSVSAAAKTTLTVSNNRTVLVAGRNYKVTTDAATDFESSNTKIATVSKDGKVTPKKTGYVTLTATVDGKTVKKKFLCVTSAGTTNSQSKVDKMLDAANVKKITIKNANTEETYVIDEGDYSKKKLVINAPLSDVKNSGSFSSIVVKDVKAGTLTNYVKNNIKITDKDFKYIEKANGSTIDIAEGAKGTVRVAGKNTEISSEGDLAITTTTKATVKEITVKGGTFEFDASKNPTVENIVVEGKSDIKITGDTKADIPVTIEKGAEGTTLETNCSVKMDVKAKVEIVLKESAGGSVVKVADNITSDIKVDSSVKGTVAVGVIGSDTTKSVSAGSDVSVAVGGVITDAPVAGGGGGAALAPFVSAAYADGVTTYKLENAPSFDTFASVTVKATIANKTETIKVTKELADYVKELVNDETAARTRWMNLTGSAVKEFGTGIKASVKTLDATNPAAKVVTFTAPSNTMLDGKTFKVVLDQTANRATIQRSDEDGNLVEGAKVIVITKSGNTTTVNVNNGESVYTVVKDSDTQVTVNKADGSTYVIKTDAGHTYFSISGDTREKVEIVSIQQ